MKRWKLLTVAVTGPLGLALGTSQDARAAPGPADPCAQKRPRNRRAYRQTTLRVPPHHAAAIARIFGKELHLPGLKSVRTDAKRGRVFVVATDSAIACIRRLVTPHPRPPADKYGRRIWILHLHHRDARAAAKQIRPLRSRRGRLVVDRPTNSLVLVDTPKAHARIRVALSVWDRPPRRR